MKKILFVLVLAALVLAGLFVAAPYRATAEIRDSIKAQDADRLARQVDFPAVRESLKVQLRAMITARAAADANAGDNPFAELASRIALSLVDGMVDAFVTPAGLASLSAGRTSAAAGVAGGEAAPAEPFANAQKVWESHDRFAILVPADNGQDVAFVLTRNGLAWQMTAIRLPPPAQP